MRVAAIQGVVHGDVQGVGYRYFVRAEARHLGLFGWVRNRSDGTVEFLACGRRESLDSFLDALRHRHKWARVERIEETTQKQDCPLTDFDIIS